METIPLAGCVMTNDAGEMLLIHRNTPELTQWELPGGKLEPGEDYKIAAIREVEEKTTLGVEITGELGQANFEHRGVLWEYHWFGAVIIRGTPSAAEAKFDDIAYVNPFGMDSSELSPNVMNLVAAIKSGAVTV